MKNTFTMRRLIIAYLLLLFSLICYGQNTAEQYMSNPSLALQDAQTSYMAGDYEKAISLIKIYSSLSGKKDGNDILTKAQQCQQYVEKAKLFEEQGDSDSASQCYNSILKINPNDSNAKSKAQTVVFDQVRSYNNGIACVRKGDKWGAIDEDRNVVIPIIYDRIQDFRTTPKQTITPVHKNGKMGFVNKQGVEVTQFIYKNIRGIEFDTPNAFFCVYKDNSPEVYVDMNGVEYPTEDEAAYGILGLKKNDTKTKGPYKIGDFYNEKSCKGVVFDVDDTGMNGKIVSLMNGYGVWALEDSKYSTTQLGLYNEYDGEENFKIIKRIQNWNKFFPAFEWCHKMGDGWYLPANNELLRIEENIDLINEGVRCAGYRPLDIVNVVSSNEVVSVSDKIYYIYYGEFQALDKKYDYHLLAVKRFGSDYKKVSSNEHEYVDMGLSVMWASCNLGASSPSEYGEYYAWGETSTKTSFTELNYKWCARDYNSLTKYNSNSALGIVDNKSVLELSDDAARVQWGGGWRMPRRREFDELRKKCTWTWTTLNEKKGYLVTSSITGNSIFLPAAGDMQEGEICNDEAWGLYWSSNGDENPDYMYDADSFQFTSSSTQWVGDERGRGLSIRPVIDRNVR